MSDNIPIVTLKKSVNCMFNHCRGVIEEGPAMRFPGEIYTHKGVCTVEYGVMSAMMSGRELIPELVDIKYEACDSPSEA